MTKADLINEIAQATGYDKITIGVVLSAYVDSVKRNLAKGENVYVRGFGSFVLKERAEKVARNIKGQSSVTVPAHKIPFFRPAAEFKASVR